jgi:hypothetical protein
VGEEESEWKTRITPRALESVCETLLLVREEKRKVAEREREKKESRGCMMSQGN